MLKDRQRWRHRQRDGQEERQEDRERWTVRQKDSLREKSTADRQTDRQTGWRTSSLTKKHLSVRQTETDRKAENRETDMDMTY